MFVAFKPLSITVSGTPDAFRPVRGPRGRGGGGGGEDWDGVWKGVMRGGGGVGEEF